MHIRGYKKLGTKILFTLHSLLFFHSPLGEPLTRLRSNDLGNPSISSKQLCKVSIGTYSNLTAFHSSGRSRPGVWGGSQFGGAKNVFTCLNTKGCLWQSCVTRKRLSFVGQEVNIFVGRTMLFQGITTVWKRFISLIQETFETGPKQWASFFTSYT